MTVSHVQDGHNVLLPLQKYKQHLISLSSPGYVNGTMNDKAMTSLRIYIISTIGTVFSRCHDMGWDGSGRLFGTYFFDGPINQHAYLNTLQNCFLSQLEKLGSKDDPWLQLDGEPAYCALPVRECLSLAFRER